MRRHVCVCVFLRHEGVTEGGRKGRGGLVFGVFIHCELMSSDAKRRCICAHSAEHRHVTSREGDSSSSNRHGVFGWAVESSCAQIEDFTSRTPQTVRPSEKQGQCVTGSHTCRHTPSSTHTLRENRQQETGRVSKNVHAKRSIRRRCDSCVLRSSFAVVMIALQTHGD